MLSPSVYISKQIETHANENNILLNNVEFLTYTKLAFCSKAEISEFECDYIILDEFHRCSAAEWGRGIDTLLKLKPDAKVLGTSATPIRYLDSSRNMAEELFHSVYAENMSLHEAIRRKILPLPIYVTSSANVFSQQLGRALACSEKATHPVIFDIVNNFETGDTAKEYNAIMEINRDGVSDDDDIEFELYDYVRDIRQILEELNETFENSWDVVYDALVEFKRKYERFPTGNEDYDGLKIGLWCRNQRALYCQGNLSDEQREKLLKLGVNLSGTEYMRVWMELYTLYVEYKDIFGEEPKAKAKYKGKDIGSWIYVQKKYLREGKLPKERVELLAEVGVT